MLYTVNLGLRDCIGFLQIWSHIACSEHQHSLVDGEIFKEIRFFITKLWSSMSIELDVNGISLFTNPVTYI